MNAIVGTNLGAPSRGAIVSDRYAEGKTAVGGRLRYIELNPVRAGMVAHPAEYRWSSYRANAQGEADSLWRPHPLYAALGDSAPTRQAAYRELFRHELNPGMVDQIRRATNGNYALGNERFASQVSEALGRRATPGRSGRPRQSIELESGELF